MASSPFGRQSKCMCIMALSQHNALDHPDTAGQNPKNVAELMFSGMKVIDIVGYIYLNINKSRRYLCGKYYYDLSYFDYFNSDTDKVYGQFLWN